jgi:hypothetical protein
MGKVASYLFGPAGQPEPDNLPLNKAIQRKLGLDDPLGKSAFFGQFKSSYPADISQRSTELYPMVREEMVSRLSG